MPHPYSELAHAKRYTCRRLQVLGAANAMPYYQVVDKNRCHWLSVLQKADQPWTWPKSREFFLALRRNIGPQIRRTPEPGSGDVQGH